MLHNYIESMNIVNEVFKLLLENTEEQEKKEKKTILNVLETTIGKQTQIT